MAAPAAVLSILVRANTGQAVTALAGVNRQLENTNRRSTAMSRGFNVAGKVAAGAAVGIAAGFAYSVKKASDFEQQISRLGAVADANARQMRAFREQALQAGKDTAFSALEAAQAQTELAKGGLSVQQIMRGGLRSALALAAAGEMDLADAATATVNAMKLFNISGKQSGQVADAFATAANATTADVADFAMALSQGGSAAKAAGLSFTETVAALEALAAVGIKNSDAGTSLKTALIQLASPTKEAKDLMQQLNLSFFDSRGNMKSLVDISSMLRKSMGDMTREQRLQTFTTLVGTDGMRALNAVFDAGPTKIAKYQQGLQKQGTAADVARKKQDNFAGSLERLQGSLETLGIRIGTAALPALRRFVDDVDTAVDQIGDIANRKDLNFGEKVNASFRVIKLAAAPWIEEIKRFVASLELPKRFGEAISEITPILVKGFADAAPKAAKAFVEGFLAADIWGRLAIGAFLISKFGGLGALRKTGVTAGGAVGAGMAGSVATGVAAGGLKGKLVGLFRSFGPSIGAGLALTVGPSLLKGLTNFHPTIPASSDRATPEKVVAQARELRKSAASAADYQKKLAGVESSWRKLADASGQEPKQRAYLNSIADAVHRLRNQFKPLGTVMQETREHFQQLAHRAGNDMVDFRSVVANNMQAIKKNLGQNSAEGQRALTENFRLARREVHRRMNEGAIDTKTGMREIRRLLVQESKAGQEGMSKAFRIARNDVKARMSESGQLTAAGLKEIRRLLRTELKLYGINTLKGAGSNAAVAERGRSIVVQGRQRGGKIDAGSPVGDTVPAMLERGEYVLNRKAVAKVGKQKLDQLNFDKAPRFQSGGMVAAANRLDRAHFPYVWGGGHQASPAPFGPMDCSGAVSYVLQHGGVKIPTMVSGALMNAGKPGAGAVTVFANQGHTFMRIGRRYFGTSNSNPGGGAGWFPDPGPAYRSGFVQRHFTGAIGADLATSIKRVVAGGADSPLKDVVQGALDKARSGANKVLEQVSESFVGGGDPGDPGPGGDFSGPWTKVMAAIAQQKHWNLGDWRKLVQGESGGDPNARNPSSGAYGLGQFLGGTARQYARYGALSRDPRQQIRAMAKYIEDRYGNPSNAYRTWLSRSPHWYAAGGLVDNDAVGLRTGGFTLQNKGPNSPTARRQSNRHRKLGRLLDKTLKKIKTEKSAKVRSQALKKLTDRIKDVGLPTGLNQNLAKFSQNAEIYADYAERAGSLTDTDAITTALQNEMDRRTAAGQKFSDADQQAMVDRMTARVGPGNLTQLQWLQKQLSVLFNWRNAIIDARNIVEQRRERMAKLIEQAKARLIPLREDFQAARTTRGELVARIERIRKQGLTRAAMRDRLKKIDAEQKKLGRHPARNRDALKRLRGEERHIRSVLAGKGNNRDIVKNLRDQVEDIDAKQKPRKRLIDALSRDPGGIISTLRSRRDVFNERRSDLVSSLTDLQGAGAPNEKLASAQMGVLGGQIFQTQLAIRDLTTKPIRVTAEATTATTAESDNQSTEMLKELLRQANLRTAVSQKQYEVFRDFPNYGGTFATGGVVPGPAGSARVIEAHGGEGVFTRDQMAAMGGAQNIVVLVQDGAVREDRIRVIAGKEAERLSRGTVRGAQRRLPGRGGGV